MNGPMQSRFHVLNYTWVSYMECFTVRVSTFVTKVALMTIIMVMVISSWPSALPNAHFMPRPSPH